MKKSFLVLLALLFVFSLCSCDDGPAPSETASGESSFAVDHSKAISVFLREVGGVDLFPTSCRVDTEGIDGEAVTDVVELKPAL